MEWVIAHAASCLVALSLSATTWAQTKDNKKNKDEGIDTVTERALSMQRKCKSMSRVVRLGLA